MAAVKPENREITVAYEGGTVSAVQGLMTYLFPRLKTRWEIPTGTTPRGRRKSFYSRRRTNADPGTVLKIQTTAGDVWSVRITGTPQDFIRAMLAEIDSDNIAGVYTERGTNFLPKPSPISGPAAAA